jgi:hypothetical protein
MIRHLSSSLVVLGLTLSATATTAGTYSLCLGEYWQDGRHAGPICPAPGGTQLYDYCYTDPIAKAAGICRQEGSTGTPTVVQTASHGGNKCGYAFYVITCQ